MKQILRMYLGDLVWQKLGQAKQEFKWRTIKDHSAPELREHIAELLPFDQGFYVEIGANDGRSFSNTYVLEKTRNWSGILVEPILHKLFESRNYRDSNKNKFIYGACVEHGYSEPNVKMYFSNLMTTSDFGKSIDWANAGSGFLQEGEEVLPFWAPSVILSDVLRQHRISKVDFLSIDVEGAELSVLKGINFDECEINLILIETEANSQAITFLKERGFEHILDLGMNHFFKKP